MKIEKMNPQRNGAPKQAMLMGEPHMLAYINEAERQMLKRNGGAEAPGPEGIPVYGFWDSVKSFFSGGSSSNSSSNNSSSSRSSSSSNNSSSSSSSSNSSSGSNTLSQTLANIFTPFDGTSYVNGVLVNDNNPNQNVGPARDADMFAGSNYAPTVNAGTANAILSAGAQNTGDRDNNSTISSPTSVTAADLANNNVETYGTTGGGSITVADGTAASDLPMVNALGAGQENQLVAPVEEAYSQLADALLESGVMNIGGKQRPEEPFDDGNPPILQYNGQTGEYTVVGALDPTQEASLARNEDGSLYVPYNGMDAHYNAAINDQVLDSNGEVAFPNGSTINGDNTNIVQVDNVDAKNTLLETGDDKDMILPGGDGTYTNTDGETLYGGEKVYDPTGGDIEFDPYDEPKDPVEPTDPTDPTGPTGPSEPAVNQALLDALARRDAALQSQLGNVASAFGFATDDYYNQLGEDYRNNGMSEAFATAYDDAIRGIYDTYKSYGMLSQADVNDDLGLLEGAKSGEEGRIDNIIDQYMNANRGYVSGGRSGIESDLRGFVTNTEDIPTIDQQTSQILGYDVSGRSAPYKTPKEQEVVDFFSDFVKRSYDPSYNVDPSAVASGGPRRVSASVDQKGAGAQPSSLAGILDPVRGGSTRVVK